MSRQILRARWYVTRQVVVLGSCARAPPSPRCSWTGCKGVTILAFNPAGSPFPNLLALPAVVRSFFKFLSLSTLFQRGSPLVSSLLSQSFLSFFQNSLSFSSSYSCLSLFCPLLSLLSLLRCLFSLL